MAGAPRLRNTSEEEEEAENVKKVKVSKLRGKSIAKKHTLVALKDEQYHRDKN